MDKRRKKKRDEGSSSNLTWQEKKDIADKEEKSLLNEIQALRAWVGMVGAMNDEQLKEYLKNRPQDLKTSKIQKKKPPPNRDQKVYRQRVKLPESLK
ncbi:unnamed protein product [Linum tenue]|uniref:Uncharacterized protein n=1 Tax=Linum tenue TaxID=586396 RepID=A0AAV0IFV6_9ROSI|nr:unnamed protein product [Linum tenue]